MSAFEHADLERLAAIVQARRLELGMSLIHAAATADMSKDTWKKCEAGQPVRASSYVRIDRTLDWAPGSCISIIEGAAGPVVVTSTGHGGVIAKDLAGEVEDSVKLAAIAVSDNLTAGEIRDLSRLVVEELKRRGKI